MKNYDTHVYLYAKHHYERTNVIDDLKIIYGKRNGIDAEHMQVRDIISCLVGLTVPHMSVNKHSFIEFLSDLDPVFCWRVGGNAPRLNNEYIHTHDSYCETIIMKCLSILSLTRVDEIEGGLDEEADPSLLPISKDAQKLYEQRNKSKH
jgi:hypothetical protein